MADLNVSSAGKASAPKQAAPKAPVAGQGAAVKMQGDALTLSKAQAIAPKTPPYNTGLKFKNIFSGAGIGLAIGVGIAGALSWFGLSAAGAVMGDTAPLVLGGLALVGCPIGGAIAGYFGWKPRADQALYNSKKVTVDTQKLTDQINNAANDVVSQRVADQAIAAAKTPDDAVAVAKVLGQVGIPFVPALDRALALSDSATTSVSVADAAVNLERSFGSVLTDTEETAHVQKDGVADFLVKAYDKAATQTTNPADALEVAQRALGIGGTIAYGLRADMGAAALKKGLGAVTSFDQAMALTRGYLPNGTAPEDSTDHLVLTRALELAKTPDQRKRVAEAADRLGDTTLAAAAK